MASLVDDNLNDFDDKKKQYTTFRRAGAILIIIHNVTHIYRIEKRNPSTPVLVVVVVVVVMMVAMVALKQCY